MSTPILRVHPAIGIARVGNSEAFYLAPETIAGLPGPDAPRTGGIPIRPGTDAETIRSSELRDAEGRFKRQAARFRIFAYPADQGDTWPAQGGEEVVIGGTIGGRVVADIVWTVHVANKKANWYQSPDEWGITAYEQPKLGQLVLRNLEEGLDPHNTNRRRRLVIDPGPRTIRGRDQGPVAFDARTPCTVADRRAEVHAVTRYPVAFPRDSFPAARLVEPQGAIDTLGELRTDADGRLIVTGGHGRAVGWLTDSQHRPGQQADLSLLSITDPVNNDQWFDDTSDGPVRAVIVFEDGGPPMEAHGAWVVTTDPAYAPQTLNVVSLWDDVYDTWVRGLDLDPRVWRDGAYDPEFRPSFTDHVQPFFKAAAQQQWNTYLPRFAVHAHIAVGQISATDDPDDTVLANLAYIRNPNLPAQAGVGAPLMPLSLGDAGQPFLSPTLTQYFFLERWAANQAKGPAVAMGLGEHLDRAALQNCLGGRFSPGIDLTFIVRDAELYVSAWRDAGCGPFRVRRKPLDYRAARRAEPFLGFGWVPKSANATDGAEPGDLSKFMALPWHADYNSCAIHPTDPNPLGSSALYWSWPAQRPVTVYVAADVARPADPSQKATLPAQRYSVRGPGTMPGKNTDADAADLANAGRFWSYDDMLIHWQDIGVILQATNIDDGRDGLYDDGWYL
ncbi:MAG TPA: LodA/GoxA family CTQ-dependent oxidase, partial [Myxococcota bacterium]|nr:LodA/GoxA family CTQ-dependent oxidase [Myxococcota bacterium]